MSYPFMRRFEQKREFSINVSRIFESDRGISCDWVLTLGRRTEPLPKREPETTSTKQKEGVNEFTVHTDFKERISETESYEAA